MCLLLLACGKTQDGKKVDEEKGDEANFTLVCLMYVTFDRTELAGT